tara:strand:+ start:1294 stop:1464 length:171 start_codon:yes stop_codon:yes gene_type:complete
MDMLVFGMGCCILQTASDGQVVMKHLPLDAMLEVRVRSEESSPLGPNATPSDTRNK